MCPVTKSENASSPAIDVEDVGILELFLVAIGRCEEEKHRVAGHQRSPPYGDVVDGRTPEMLSRHVDPKRLPEGVGDPVEVVYDTCPLVRILEEAQRGAREDLGERLDGAHQQKCEVTCDFFITEATSIEIEREVCRDGVVAIGSLDAASADEILEIEDHVLCSLDGVGRHADHTPLSMEIALDHLLKHRLVFDGEAVDDAGCPQGDRRCEVAHCVEPALGEERLEEGSSMRAELGLDAGDGAWHEVAPQMASNLGVNRRVHRVEARQHADVPRAELHDGGSAGTREILAVRAGVPDVLEAGESPTTVLFHVMDRALRTQSSIDRMRIHDHLLR